MVASVLIIVIIALVLFFSVKETVKHFKGESGCCGGGKDTVKIKKQKLKTIEYTQSFCIEGMKCQNCANRIDNELNSIQGINSKVSLKEKTVIVKADHNVIDQEIIDIINHLGYKASVNN